MKQLIQQKIRQTKRISQLMKLEKLLEKSD